MRPVYTVMLYVLGAPLVGGILYGLDRKLAARMQGRVGPPIIQPFYDVLKLFRKERLVVRRAQNFYIFFFLFFTMFTGSIFFAGDDILLVVFALTLADIFFVLSGYKTSSPFSFIGAERELLQMVIYEPAVLLVPIGLFMMTRSFKVADITASVRPLALYLPGVLFGLVYILAIKFRKSPFDFSTSHHGHQEVVKGITTEFSGLSLALIEVAHWYETVVILGFIYLFFSFRIAAGVAASLVAFFLITLVDNVFARVKWHRALRSSWTVAMIFGIGNMIVLYVLQKWVGL
jgi:ech hydrogenase subunit B